MIGQVAVAAAVALTGIDLFRDMTWRVSAKERRLYGLALGGSTVVGDFYADLFVDQYHVGRFYNTALLWPNKDDLIPLKGNLVPPGATLAFICGINATGNPVNTILV